MHAARLWRLKMQGFEENEISKNAFGGTEITKRSLAKLVPEELSKEFQIIPSRFRTIEETRNDYFSY